MPKFETVVNDSAPSDAGGNAREEALAHRCLRDVRSSFFFERRYVRVLHWREIRLACVEKSNNRCYRLFVAKLFASRLGGNRADG